MDELKHTKTFENMVNSSSTGVPTSKYGSRQFTTNAGALQARKKNRTTTINKAFNWKKLIEN